MTTKWTNKLLRMRSTGTAVLARNRIAGRSPWGRERQTVQQMRSELARPDCLIVALIRHAGREHRRECREMGIDLVLVKPVELAVMETLLLLECTRKNRLRTESGRSPWL